MHRPPLIAPAPAPAPPVSVSVIMAAYNGARLIGETIDSVLAQTFTDWELVIVDDGSTDDTLATVRRYTDPRIALIAAETNGGPVQARNRAMAAARGRYIAGLDHDDLCHPERFARQVAFLDAHPDTVLVGAIAAQLRDGVARLPAMPHTTPDFLDWMMTIENPLAWSATMFRGEAARALAPFERQERVYAEDFDLYHRIRRHGRIARIDEALISYRIHPGSASQRHEQTMHANVELVLADAQAALLGDEARATAGAVLRHATIGRPAPDAATLQRVTDTIFALRERFLATRFVDAPSRRLIDAQAALYWRFMVRVAVRARTVTLRDALATLPRELPLRDALHPGVLLSPLVAVVKARRGDAAATTAWT